MLGRFHRSTRAETADGFESNFALYYLSRFLFSHGLGGLMQRAEHPVVLNFGGAGLTGPVRWDDLQLRRRYPGTGALGHSAALCDLLGVSFTATHADPPIRYVLNHPGVVVTSFSGEYDAETAAQVDLLKVTGKAGHAGRSPDPAVPRRPARPAHSSAGGPPSAHRQPRVRPCSRRAPARGDRATARRPPRVAHPRHALAPGPPAVGTVPVTMSRSAGRLPPKTASIAEPVTGPSPSMTPRPSDGLAERAGEART